MTQIRVLIADDHRILREGLRSLLSECEDLEVVGEAADGREAVDLCAKHVPDVVLMDLHMPGLGGLEATLEIRRETPRVRVLVLTQYEDREYVRRLLAAGASGFVLKRAAGAALVDAIRAVHRGGLVLDPEVARDVVTSAGRPQRGDPFEALTDREKQVFKLIAEGRSSKEVATMLDISVKTAMTHREHLMGKLQVHNRTELVRLAVKLGVVRFEP